MRERYCRRGGVNVKIYLKIEFLNNRQDEISKWHHASFGIWHGDAEKGMVASIELSSGVCASMAGPVSNRVPSPPADRPGLVPRIISPCMPGTNGDR